MKFNIKTVIGVVLGILMYYAWVRFTIPTSIFGTIIGIVLGVVVFVVVTQYDRALTAYKAYRALKKVKK